MTNFKSTYVTKYDNAKTGVSGDNTIPTGYIRTVENVWIDQFAFTAVLTTADTIKIADIPQNRRITAVEVYIPAGFAPTTATINVGISGSTSLLISSSTSYVVGNAAATGSTVMVNNKVELNNPSGIGYVVTGSSNPIYLSIGVTAATAPTAGTITTIVRYT